MVYKQTPFASSSLKTHPTFHERSMEDEIRLFSSLSVFSHGASKYWTGAIWLTSRDMIYTTWLTSRDMIYATWPTSRDMI